MKFIKIIILILAFFILNVQQSNAAVGCRLGDIIYSQKLGTTKFYGTNYDVYKINGQNYTVDYDNQSIFGGVNVNNVSQPGNQCWINSYLNPKNNQDNALWGNLVTFTVNPPQNLPLDDYTWLFLLPVGGLGVYYLSRKTLAV
ncbi:MAG: hypothetical protein V4541_11375 [Bacteroidota bacterium]